MKSGMTKRGGRAAVGRQGVGRVQGKGLSLKYVGIYLVEIIYHLKKCLMFDLVSVTNWMGGEMRRVTI